MGGGKTISSPISEASSTIIFLPSPHQWIQEMNDWFPLFFPLLSSRRVQLQKRHPTPRRLLHPVQAALEGSHAEELKALLAVGASLDFRIAHLEIVAEHDSGAAVCEVSHPETTAEEDLPFFLEQWKESRDIFLNAPASADVGRVLECDAILQRTSVGGFTSGHLSPLDGWPGLCFEFIFSFSDFILFFFFSCFDFVRGQSGRDRFGNHF